MRWLALLLFSVSAGISGLFLAGCPDGVGLVDGQDGDADADADADAANSSETGTFDGGGGGDSNISTPVGSGALCGANGRDDCGAYAYCNATLGCVECLGDSDCSAALSRCLGGSCTAACTEDSGTCASGTSCDTDARVCAACGPDAGCTKGVCSDTTRRCGECASNTDCGGSTPRCRVLVGSCVSCISNDDCGHSAPVCDPLTFACRVGCTSDVQCPGQTCDLKAAVCVDLPVDAGAGTMDAATSDSGDGS